MNIDKQAIADRFWAATDKQRNEARAKPFLIGRHAGYDEYKCGKCGAVGEATWPNFRITIAHAADC